MIKKELKKIISSHSFISYGFLVFLITLILMSYLVLKGMKGSLDKKIPIDIKEEKVDDGFMPVYNQITALYNGKRYGQMLDSVQDAQKKYAKKEQQEILLYLEAMANYYIGFNNISIELLEKAKKLKETKWTYILLGMNYEMLRHSELAQKEYLKATKFEKLYSFGYEKIGDLFFKEREFKKALIMYNKNSDFNEISLLKSAIVNYILGNFNESIEQIERYVDYVRDRRYIAYALFINALNYEQLRSYEEAEAMYIRSIGASKKESRSLIQYYYGMYLLKNDDVDRGIDILNTLILEESPYLDQSKFLISRYYFSKGEYRRSFRLLNEVYREVKNAEILNYYIFSTIKINNFKLAEDLIEEAKSYEQTDEVKKNIYIAEFFILIKNKKYDEINPLMSVVLEDLKNSPEVVKNISVIILNELDEKNKFIVFNFLSKNNQNGFFDDIIGDHLVEQKDYQLALSIYLKKISKESDDANIYKNIGDIYMKIENLDKALFFYEKALSKKIDYVHRARIYNNLAYIHYIQKENAKFVEQLNVANLTDVDEPMILYNMAMLEKYQSKEEYIDLLLKSKSMIEKRSKKARERVYSSVYYELGLSYIKNNNKEIARQVLREALDLDPSNNLAAHRLSEIRK